MIAIGCYQDTDDSFTVVETQIPETIIETGVSGRVLDSDGGAMTGVSLVIDNQTYQVEDPFFFFDLKFVKKLGQPIFIDQNGKEIGMVNPLLIENDINYLDIKTFPTTNTSVINSDNPLLSVSDEINVTIDINNIISENGTKYTDPITVDFRHTSDQDIIEQVGYYGFNAKGGLLSLENVSMFSFELFDDSGIVLNSDGASHTFSILSSTSKMLLWLDKKDGLWREVTTITDGETFNLDKTGYFLIADAYDAVYNEGTVGKESLTVAYLDYQWTDSATSEVISGKSTAKGKWATVTKPESTVNINFLSPCQQLIEEAELTVRSANHVDYEIDLEDQENYFSVQTKVINCEGEFNQLPALTVKDDDQKFTYVFSEELIETWLPVCQESFEITGYNVADPNEGPSLDWSIYQTDNITFLSDCEEYQNGFSYLKIRDDEQIYNSLSVTVDGMITKLSEEEHRLRLNFSGTDVRNYSEEEVRIFIEDQRFGEDGYFIRCENSPLGCGIDDFKVTHFGNNNEGWLRITFGGTLWMQTIEPRLAGNFNIEGVILTKL